MANAVVIVLARNGFGKAQTGEGGRAHCPIRLPHPDRRRASGGRPVRASPARAQAPVFLFAAFESVTPSIFILPIPAALFPPDLCLFFLRWTNHPPTSHTPQAAVKRLTSSGPSGAMAPTDRVACPRGGKSCGHCCCRFWRRPPPGTFPPNVRGGGRTHSQIIPVGRGR